MAELQPSKLIAWVRFPSPAPLKGYTLRPKRTYLIKSGIHQCANAKAIRPWGIPLFIHLMALTKQGTSLLSVLTTLSMDSMKLWKLFEVMKVTAEEQQVVDHVVEQITQSFPVQSIILFGSRARGDATEDSDYDFLVVMNFTQRRALVAMELRKIAHITRIPMDFLVRLPIEWEVGFLLKKEIMAEGKVVYEATDTRVGEQSADRSDFRQGTV